MAQLNPDSIFQSWILSQQETIQGSMLTSAQKRVIQNQIAQLAQEKTLLKFDPANIHSFTQREAELQGSISALQFLLATSTEFEKEFDPGMVPITIQTPQEF